MATAAPHVKLLRQLASAKDDYLSGAFDISWDGAKATLYLVFGRPSHAVFDTDQAQIEGEAAIDALLAELPRTFVVSDWRRAMSPQETLSISIDELAGPFVRLAGSYADDPVSDENPEWWSSDDSSPDLAFGLADFPLLPGGRPLWAETSPENVNLAERLAELPPSILILTGAKLRAAAVVSGGDIIDAVWIDDEDQARGEAAGMAILGATKGSLAGYALDDPRVAEALTMLWRLPLAVDDIEMAWLDPASMLAAFRADGLDRVLVIDAPVRGIALFSRGGLVAVYSETQRSAVASPERLRSLLSQARGRLTVMERKPRPVAAGAAPTIPSAVDFFSVVADPEPDVEAPSAAEPEVEAPGAAEPADVADEATSAVVEPEAHDTTLAEPASAWSHPFLREHPIVPAEQTAEPGAEDEADAVAVAPEAGDTEAIDEPIAHDIADTEPAAETADVQPEAAAAAPAGDEAGPDIQVAEGATDLVAAAPAGETDAPPPPPPGETGDAAAVDHAPPPPAPEAAAAEPSRKGKRPWWAFGTRRKSSQQVPSDADKAAAEAAAAKEVAEAAAAAGWGVRQSDAAAPPPWARPRDYTLVEPETASVTEAPPPAPDAAVDEATTLAVPTWSVIEPGATPAEEPAAASTDVEEAEPSATASVDAAEAERATDAVIGGVAATVEPDAIAGTPDVEPAVVGGNDAVEPAVGDVASAEEPTGHHVPPADDPGAVEDTASAEPGAVDHADTGEPADDDSAHAEEPAPAPAPAWSVREVIADSVSWYRPAQTETSSDAHEDTENEAAEAGDEGAAAVTDHESFAGGDDEHASVAHSDHEPAADTEQEAATEAEHDVAAESADEPAAGEHDATAAEHLDHDNEAAGDLEPVAAASGGDAASDFWAEFATPDPDASSADAEHDPESLTASDATAETDAHTDEESEPAPDPASAPEHEPVAAEAESVKPKSSERTFAPWNWPLAEAEAPVAPAPVGGRSASLLDETHDHVTADAGTEHAPQAGEPETDAGAEQGFFQRDEPVGSQFVDFDEVRRELVQIGVVWLGERNAIPVTALLTKTRSTIDDFVATIDTIRGMHVEGQDPASIQAMAREMHQQAAERLCGA